MATRLARKAATPLTSRNHAKRPHSVPILAAQNESDAAPDGPFAEGAQDTIDPNLRHRMISEAAYQRYVERGYADGYDVEDWLQSETDVDHILLDRAPA